MTNYDLGANRVTAHWLPRSVSPLRPSALRSLGAMANTFANESFMDELAALAEVDPRVPATTPQRSAGRGSLAGVPPSIQKTQLRRRVATDVLPK